jgi:hypothetical protein
LCFSSYYGEELFEAAPLWRKTTRTGYLPSLLSIGKKTILVEHLFGRQSRGSGAGWRGRLASVNKCQPKGCVEKSDDQLAPDRRMRSPGFVYEEDIFNKLLFYKQAFSIPRPSSISASLTM